MGKLKIMGKVSEVEPCRNTVKNFVEVTCTWKQGTDSVNFGAFCSVGGENLHTNLYWVTNWCIMAFQTLNCCNLFGNQPVLPKFCASLVTCLSYNLLS